MVVIMTSLLGIFFFGVDSAFSAIVQAPARPAELSDLKLKERQTMSRWYIIHAYSGFENKVRDAIMAEATRLGLAPLVEAVEVPTEKVTEVRRGKKVTSRPQILPRLRARQAGDERRRLPPRQEHAEGHRLPRLDAASRSRSRDAEAARILNTKDEAAAAAPKTKISVDYEIGDNVKVLDGPFASFNGIVEELDFDRGRVKVGVSIFGRATPVELEFEQVELVK